MVSTGLRPHRIAPTRDCAHVPVSRTLSLPPLSPSLSLTQQFQSEAWDLICTLLYMHCTYSSIDLSLSFDFIFWLLIILWIVFKNIHIKDFFLFTFFIFTKQAPSLSFCLCVCLYLSLPPLSFFLTFFLPPCLSFYLSLSPTPVCLYIFLSLPPCLSFYLSLSPTPVCLYIFLSPCLSISL